MKFEVFINLFAAKGNNEKFNLWAGFEISKCPVMTFFACLGLISKNFSQQIFVYFNFEDLVLSNQREFQKNES